MEKLKKNREYIVGLILLIVVCFPMLEQGIMCNDELLLRIWRQKGWDCFFETTILIENIQKGRILGTIGNLKFLGYISENKYIFRLIDVSFLLVAIGLFGYIAYRFTKEKKFATLLSTLILVFLPLTFEFAAPNAFLIVVTQPLILLELSIINYLNYLESGKKGKLIFSTFFFMWGMFLYEFVITYVLLFPAIYYVKNYDKSIDIKKLICINLPMLLTAIVYLLLYIIQGIVLPTNYTGNQLGIESIGAVINVLKMLFISACPGYYAFFNNKYDFLFNYYNHGGITLKNILNPLLIVFVIALTYIVCRLLCEKNDKLKWNGKKKALVSIIALIYGFLPALPNGISTMYQGGVTPESFTSLPVSLFLYFSIMFLVTFSLWNICKTIGKETVSLVFVLLIVVVSSVIQINNYVFAEEQSNNFERIEAIEDFLELDYLNIYNNEDIVAPSLYETRNSMAVEEGRWTQYVNLYGKSINFIKDTKGESEWKIEMQDDNSFFVYSNEQMLLVTKDEKEGMILVNDVYKTTYPIEIDKCIYQERDYNVYSLNKVI